MSELNERNARKHEHMNWNTTLIREWN